MSKLPTIRKIRLYWYRYLAKETTTAVTLAQPPQTIQQIRIKKDKMIFYANRIRFPLFYRRHEKNSKNM